MELLTAEETQMTANAGSEFGGILETSIALSRRIADDATYREAGELVVKISKRRKWWADFCRPAKQKLDGLKKELLDRERQVDEPLERALAYLKPSMLAYDAKVQEERRLKEAEIQRQLRKQQEDAALATAQTLEAQGRKAEAEIVLDTPVMTPSVVLPKTNKVAGVATVTTWNFRITDPTKVPREYLAIDEQKIRGVVRAMKDLANIPGVEVFSETSLRAGGR